MSVGPQIVGSTVLRVMNSSFELWDKKNCFWLIGNEAVRSEPAIHILVCAKWLRLTIPRNVESLLKGMGYI